MQNEWCTYHILSSNQNGLLIQDVINYYKILPGNDGVTIPIRRNEEKNKKYGQ